MVNELIEKLSDLEHQQWEHWSKTVAKELETIRYQCEISDEAKKIIDARLERWEKNWKTYDELDEKTKEYDRKWARLALAIFSSRVAWLKDKIEVRLEDLKETQVEAHSLKIVLGLIDEAFADLQPKVGEPSEANHVTEKGGAQ